MQKPTTTTSLFFLLTLIAVFTDNIAHGFSIKSSTAAGSACKASQAVNVTGSDNAIVIRFPELNTGRDQGKRLSRLNCNVSITSENMENRQFRLAGYKTSYDSTQGSAQEITLKISSWFQADKNTISAELKIPTGNVKSSSWQGTFNGNDWSPCVSTVVLNAGVAMIAKSNSTLTSNTVVEFKDGIEISLEWRDCAGSKK